MNLKYYHANRLSRDGNQIAEVLEIGRIAIGRETTDYRLHLLYGQNITDLLQKGGYEVNVKEIDAHDLNSKFSELSFVKYEGEDCDVYCFEGLAVKADLREGITWHIQESLSAEQLENIWPEAEIDVESPDGEIRIPADSAGQLAVQMEQLWFDSWLMLEAMPGEEMPAEDRLELLQDYYETVSQGDSLCPEIDRIRELLLLERRELRDKLAGKRQEETAGESRLLKQVEELIHQAESLRQEDEALLPTDYMDSELEAGIGGGPEMG